MFREPITSDAVLDKIQSFGGDLEGIAAAHQVVRTLRDFNPAATKSKQDATGDRSIFVVGARTYRYGYASLNCWYVFIALDYWDVKDRLEENGS